MPSDDTLHSDLIISYGIINNFPFVENFETGTTYYFRTRNSVIINNVSANNSDYGVEFKNGDMIGTDSATVWGADESTFPTLYSCNVNPQRVY
jgi:hypothetical protein